MSDKRYLDTCDRCFTVDSQAIPPIKTIPSGPNGILATYRCPTCREVWTCGWSAQDEDAA